MPTIKLTQAAVDKIAAPKTGRMEHFDSLLPGFGLRVSHTGSKAWVVFFRIGKPARLRRYTMGSLATYPKVDEARDRARAILQDVEKGIDPATIEPPPSLPEPIDPIRAVVTQFIERYAKQKNRSWAETDRLLKRHVVSRWGDRAADAITRRDVLDLLDDLVERGNPIAANRVLATIRKMFGWAVERDILSKSPVVNIKAPGKETERERVLDDAELVAVWRAAEKAGGVPGAFVRLLVLTGQRRDEVAGMRWGDMDLEKKVWTLPREQTKGDRTHEVPLSPLAVEIMTELPHLGSYVLTSRGFRRVSETSAAEGRLTDRDRPISGYSKIKAALDTKIIEMAAKEASERGEDVPSQVIAPWRFHDLRRTAATGMARLGIATSTISRVLNHKEGGVTKIYNRYGYLDEKRHALETWARKMESLIRPSLGNVVAIRSDTAVAAA